MDLPTPEAPTSVDPSPAPVPPPPPPPPVVPAVVATEAAPAAVIEEETGTQENGTSPRKKRSMEKEETAAPEPEVQTDHKKKKKKMTTRSKKYDKLYLAIEISPHQPKSDFTLVEVVAAGRPKNMSEWVEECFDSFAFSDVIDTYKYITDKNATEACSRFQAYVDEKFQEADQVIWVNERPHIEFVELERLLDQYGTNRGPQTDTLARGAPVVVPQLLRQCLAPSASKRLEATVTKATRAAPALLHTLQWAIEIDKYLHL